MAALPKDACGVSMLPAFEPVLATVEAAAQHSIKVRVVISTSNAQGLPLTHPHLHNTAGGLARMIMAIQTCCMTSLSLRLCM